jgi:hypothetical protein
MKKKIFEFAGTVALVTVSGLDLAFRMPKYIFLIFILLTSSCTRQTIRVVNENKGKLIATHELVIDGEKKFYLDSVTAPFPPYIQMITDSTGSNLLTFLNPYNNSIYFYNYTGTNYINRIQYYREGANAILKPAGYYIHNMDSIYIYNMPMTEIVLSNGDGAVKNRISLRSNDPEWPLYLPQYLLSTVNPIYEIGRHLIITGQSFFSIPEQNLAKFRFSAYIDMQSNHINYSHTYPEEIYGKNSNWEGGLPTQVYPALSPNGSLLYSFPASHDLYISDYNSGEYKKVYGGGNNANTIRSIDREAKNTQDELVVAHYLQQDMYAAVLYDKFRNIYYRFLLKGVPGATFSTPKEEKTIIIIIMDENFNYLGETNIGTGKEWNWNNSFITREGLNIEYIGDDLNEDYLIFKIFSPDSIN